MSHLKAYIKAGHWQVQEKSKMPFTFKRGGGGICSLPYQQHITLISCPLQWYYILPNISIGLGPALKWI